ncbi:MAG TPA: TadE/TadG family type IV pilus assembly protein [Gemmatimonadaceae bacterium]|nr:TadE/TadG family type IV pilus assembly protein [Gemmatimonadaceae bacterium]
MMQHLVRRVRALRDERGAALVEFALVVPFLMVIMCATIDFGLAVYTVNNLTGAVREGARFAAVMPLPPGVNDGQIKTRVVSAIVDVNSGLTPTQVRALVTNTAMDPLTGDITVSITGYPYRPFTPLASLLGFSTIAVNRRAIFRYERSS